MCVLYISVVISVNFSKSTYKINESNGTACLVLVLSDPSSFDITIQVNSTDGLATGYTKSDNETTKKDYELGPYDVNFSAGITTAQLSIAINNDSLLEDDENFTLTIINSPSLPHNVSVGDPGKATVTIMNDDCK